MSSERKELDDLSPTDLKACAVWQFTDDESLNETVVCPVRMLPVKSLTRRIVGTAVHLSNGSEEWAFLSNIDLMNPQWNPHLTTITVLSNRGRFHLARYHDIDNRENGPMALATFLQIPIDEVFPISYDISSLAVGNPLSLRGWIDKEPPERLTRGEIIKLALQVSSRASEASS
jgi:hypothetical protein